MLGIASVALLQSAVGFTVDDAGQLPTAVHGLAAATDGDRVFLFGGHDGAFRDGILHYDPVDEMATPAAALLPQGLAYASAVWMGTAALIMGGTTSEGITAEVFRYDPVAERLEAEEPLPFPVAHAAAVWTGAEALLFGGRGPGGALDSVIRYVPDEGGEVQAVALPTPRVSPSAVWTGDVAYIAGGRENGDGPSVDEILLYDPAAGSPPAVASHLPAGRHVTSASWDGRSMFVFGGADGAAYWADIVRFEPDADLVELLPVALPSGRGYTAAAWVGSEAVVAGGFGGSNVAEIIKLKVPDLSVTGEEIRVQMVRREGDLCLLPGHVCHTFYRVDATVRNKGAGESGAFEIDFEVRDDLGTTEVGPRVAGPFPSVAAGGSARIVLMEEWEPQAVGPYRVLVTLDPGGRVYERGEDNNAARSCRLTFLLVPINPASGAPMSPLCTP